MDGQIIGTAIQLPLPLTDEWIKAVAGEYTILIYVVFPWFVLFLLQAIAIVWPGAKANQIRELFQAMWPVKKG